MCTLPLPIIPIPLLAVGSCCVARPERPLAALAGEAGEDATAVLVEELDELVACVGQDARRGDLVGLAGVDVAFDRDVACAESIGRNREANSSGSRGTSSGST